MAEITYQPESQKQRWVKYGVNVALAVVVAAVLAVVATALAQRVDKRIDTTAGGVYSLKPQTIAVISNLKQPVKLVSLYSRQTNRQGKDAYAQTVEDLLQEYREKGNKVEVEFIDPIAQPAKSDALINEVTSKYGGEVKKYKSVLDDYNSKYDDLKKRTAAEADAVAKLPFDKVDDQELARTMLLIMDTVQAFPQFLETRKDAIDRQLKQKPPDYKGATDSVSSAMDELSQRVAAIQAEIAKTKDSKGVPPEVASYLTASGPRFAEIKKIADDLVNQIKNLGDLKLDTLRQSLRERDSILVMGENDLRVLPFARVWQTDSAQIKQYAKAGDIKPKFAGEQQITTAIFALEQSTKPKVVFVRPGGATLTDAGIAGLTQGGPLSEVAQRLKDYNFDVLEKDLSGQYAMQAQMQGQPAPPEPSDAEIKDAVWVVLAYPMNQQQNPMMGTPPSVVGPKLAEHLKEGGSALVIPFPQDDSVVAPLKDWGIDLRTDAVAVHATDPSRQSVSGDPADELQKFAYVFDIKDYGDAPMVKPLRSLDSLLVPLMPVKTHSVTDVNVMPIIPIPDEPKAPKSWGETDLQGLQKGDQPTFDAAVDVPGPLAGGAAAEKKGAGRLIVIASPTFAFNRTLDEPDPDLARRGLFVSRFPGNAELFTDAVFWCAKMDTMIAISPSAMDVPRIADMSDAALAGWRVGVLLVGLPGLVIISGIMMYLARRD